MRSTEIISDAFDLYKRFFAHFAGIGLTIYVVTAVIVLLSVFLGIVGAIIAFIVLFASGFLLTGALVNAVADVRDGRVDLSIGETLSKTLPYLGTLVVVGILAGIAISIGLVLLIVPGLFLITIWFVLSPAIVLENCSIGESFGRSYRLVKQAGWATFGVAILTFLIVFVANFIITLILTPLPDWLAGFISTIVSGAVFAPFLATATTLTYYRLKEMEGGAPPATEPPPATSSF
jgi:MFS family permease